MSPAKARRRARDGPKATATRIIILAERLEEVS
jgi:hypothetical protein